SLSSAAFATAAACSAYFLVNFSHDSFSPLGHLLLGRAAAHSLSCLPNFWASSQFSPLPAVTHFEQRPSFFFSAFVPPTAFMISLIAGFFPSAPADPIPSTIATPPPNTTPNLRSIWATPASERMGANRPGRPAVRRTIPELARPRNRKVTSRSRFPFCR